MLDHFPVSVFSALVVLLAIPFVPGLFGPFLLDDWGNFETLIGVTPDPLHIYSVVFGNRSGLLLRPIANASFVLNLLVTGPAPFYFKLSNLVLHATTTVAIFALSMKVLEIISVNQNFRSRQLSALVTCAIWMLHPLQVSTVMYAVQRMAILSALFSVLAILFALKWDSRQPTSGRRSYISIALFFGFTCLAVLSKENGALTPLMLATILFVGSSNLRSTAQRTDRRLWLLAIWLPLGVGLLALAAMWDSILGGYAGRPFTLGERLLTQPVVLASYLKSIFFPSPSNMGLFLDDIPFQRIESTTGWMYVGVTAVITGLAIAFRKQAPIAAFAVLWFLACHALESTFIPLELAFEHRNYLALFGPALLSGSGLSALMMSKRPVVGFACCVAVALILCIATFNRTIDWSSEASFARAESANRPNSVRAQTLLGNIEKSEGDLHAYESRMARVKEIQPLGFVPWAIEMEVACENPSHIVPWSEIRKRALAAGGNPEVMGYLNHITLQTMRGSCSGIERSTLDREFKVLGSELLEMGSVRATLYLLLLRGSLAESLDPEAARAIFREAMELQPTALDVVLRVVQFELKYGDPRVASELLGRAEESTAWFSPSQYQLRKMRAHINGVLNSTAVDKPQ